MPIVNAKTNLLALLQGAGYVEPGLPGMEGKGKGSAHSLKSFPRRMHFGLHTSGSLNQQTLLRRVYLPNL